MSGDPKPARAPITFWILGLILVGYVAACTGQRENKLGADAWEHQRVVLALTRQLWKPGNPTYASDYPSVRYSPYMIGCALVCRLAKIDPYTALSGAAVVNTALLVVGVWMLLGEFNERRSATAILLVMVALWGGPPGYANSYALADLPWHQVNPSAFSFGLTLIAWSLLRRLGSGKWSTPRFVLILLLSTEAMLDHPMTGAFGIAGLFVIAVTGPIGGRRRMFLTAGAVVVGVGLLCLAWPWYSFLAAVRNRQDNDYWFNRGVFHLTLTLWCAPAMLCMLFAVPLRNRPLVWTCIVGGLVAIAAEFAALLTHSPVLARFLLPGMIYFHLAIGIFAHEAGIFRLSSWRDRFRMLAGSPAEAAVPITQIVLVALLAYVFIPQLTLIATEPHLGRAYIGKVIHVRDLQYPVRRQFAKLLDPVGEKDVVLSDPETSWVIPAFRGRIVAAIHFELFQPNQPIRLEAVDHFFQEGTTTADRKKILQDYHVRWILLNRVFIGDRVYNSLLRKSAVVSQTSDMVVMSVPEWISETARSEKR
jgi:hypothetical protein